ncbi:MAG: hypothetical protein ACK54P_09545 [Bacteroidota bacterium]
MSNFLKHEHVRPFDPGSLQPVPFYYDLICRQYVASTFGRRFPFSMEFDRTTLTSLVPPDRLTERAAALTPDETQTVIR